MSLKSYVVSRILLTIPMVFLLLTLVFFIIRVMPGDPALLHFERHVSPEVLAEFRRRLGLDLPIWQQYVNYILDLLRGDFGISMQDYTPIRTHLIARFPATLELSIFSGFFAIAFGLILGVISARKYNSPTDHSIRLLAIVTYAIPVFFLGMIFQIIFAVWLRILPSGLRFDPHYSPPATITGLYTIDSILTGNIWALGIAIRYLILPSVTLGIILLGVFIRLTRTNMLETQNSDYVTSAEARGLSNFTITYRYSLKNAFLPILTMIGLQVAILLAGAVLTETTFSWPGLGTYLVDRIYHRDYTAIQGTVVFFAIMVALVTLIVDILYAYLDPRIRL
ncbi:MAG: ABC transporter permease [Candidatus Thorarchaeota archaeon]